MKTMGLCAGMADGAIIAESAGARDLHRVLGRVFGRDFLARVDTKPTPANPPSAFRLPLKAFVAYAPRPPHLPAGIFSPLGRRDQAAKPPFPQPKCQRERGAATIPLLPSGEKMPAGR
ncbi:hypothetical protein EFD55_28855 [Rhizobium pisi]|uniref:Uncharacterized protein n=1 Tax=Rhizobium pisi TaxID=574561 RepID=A0A3R9GUZ5_9HYPH|nr:hypothetical protein EFD55_28855 [Rhizobium pisi]